MARPRPHVYRADPALPPDHNGRRPCAVCGMWRENDRHVDEPVDEVSARIVGEGGESGSRPD